ncbi:LPD3 domain-containing protein [Dyadobacter linearis]|nr:hypothetical protein [Dyadobacter sp. CECT 9623]
MELNQLRKLARERAKNELVGKNVGIYRPELGGEIRFSISGIKECINQPFHQYVDKVKLIIDGLEESLANAEYLGYTESQTHFKPHVKGYYYFKTEIGGIPAYFNIQLTLQNKFFLYSITENIHEGFIKKNT